MRMLESVKRIKEESAEKFFNDYFTMDRGALLHYSYNGDEYSFYKGYYDGNEYKVDEIILTAENAVEYFNKVIVDRVKIFRVSSFGVSFEAA